MKKIIMYIIVVAIVALAIYLEDYAFRGAGMLVGSVVVLVGLFIDDVFNRRSELSEAFSVTGVLLSLFFYVGIGLGIHFKETTDGRIEVRSAFYTHVLEYGERIETRVLHSHFTKDGGHYAVENETFTLLYHGDSCSIYNNYNRVLDIPNTYLIIEKDYEHGKLHHIVVDGNTFDMRGTQIDQSYSPFIVDITPDFTNSNL